MNNFKGIAVGITSPVVCKISRLILREIESFVYILETVDHKEIFLLSNDITNHTSVHFRVTSNLVCFHDGDILLLTPEGIGSVIYENNSNDNYIILTEECNCSCIMCPQPSKRHNDNSIKIAVDTIRLMNPDTSVLGITGGEPTVKYFDLLNVLSECDQAIPNTLIQLLTNGRVLKDFAKAKDLISSRKERLFFCIPLYGDIDSLHDMHMGQAGSFWDTVNGLHNLGRLGASVEIRILITNYNYKRLNQISEFLYHSMPFVDHIAFMGIEAMGFAKKNIYDIWVDPAVYADRLLSACKYLWRRGMNISIFNHPLCVIPKEIWPISQRSISEWKISYLPECIKCVKRDQCGGMFNSSKEFLNSSIRAVS